MGIITTKFNGGTVTGQTVYTGASLGLSGEASVQFKPHAGSTAAGIDQIEWYDDAGNLLGYLVADGTIDASLTGTQANFTFRLNRAGAAFLVQDSSFAELFRAEGASKLGFFAATPVVKPTVTGAKLPSDVALASLLTALANLGLITNSTT